MENKRDNHKMYNEDMAEPVMEQGNEKPIEFCITAHSTDPYTVVANTPEEALEKFMADKEAVSSMDHSIQYLVGVRDGYRTIVAKHRGVKEAVE